MSTQDNSTKHDQVAEAGRLEGKPESSPVYPPKPWKKQNK